MEKKEKKKLPINWIASIAACCCYVFVFIVMIVSSVTNTKLPASFEFVFVISYILLFETITATLISLYYLIKEFTLCNFFLLLLCLLPWIFLWLTIHIL